MIAKDHGQPPRSGRLSITVNLVDSNDNAPAFQKSSYEINVVENIAPGTTILRVSADDSDYGPNGEMTYSLSARNSDDVKSTFGIESATGELFVTGVIDYELSDTYYVYVQATDKGELPLASVTLVTIHVIDVNDNRPQINVNLLSAGDKHARVSERANVGAFVAKVSIVDADSGENGRATAELLPPASEYFSLQPMYINEYKVVTSRLLDREQTSEFNLTIRVEDKGARSLGTTSVLKVEVLDENDNPPHFNQSLYVAEITENNLMGAFIYQLAATDRDAGDNARVVYSVQPPYENDFHINPNTGILSARKQFDREEAPSVDVKIMASDRGQPPLSSSTIVRVVFKDENDNSPVFDMKSYRFVMQENQPVSSLIGTVTATDSDDGLNGEIVYSMGNIVAEFSIDPKTGGIYTNRKLDREKEEVFHFVVVATNPNAEQRFDAANVTIIVEDINDNIPMITFPSGSDNVVFLPENSLGGAFVCTVVAYDEDRGQNGKLTYDFMDGNGAGLFKINRKSGDITIAKALKPEWVGLHKLIVKVTDRGRTNNVAVAALNVIIHPSNMTANETLMYLLGDSVEQKERDVSPASFFSSHFTLIVAMSALSALLIFALVALIVMYRRKSGENHAYNVRTEAQRIFAGIKRRLPSTDTDCEAGQCTVVKGDERGDGRKDVDEQSMRSADCCSQCEKGCEEQQRCDSNMTGNFSWVFCSRAGSGENSTTTVRTNNRGHEL